MCGEKLDSLIGADTELGKRYTEKLPELIAKAAIDAHEKRAVVRASAAIGKEEGVSFNRRFHMKDGTDLLEYAALYGDASGFLFDTYRAGDLPGGTEP